MNPTTTSKPRRVAGLFLTEAPEAGWKAELRAAMRRLGYHDRAAAETVEYALGSLTLAGCESVDPDVPALDEVLAECRTDHDADRPDAPPDDVFEPTAAERSWASATSAARFEGTVARNLTEDPREGFLARLDDAYGPFPTYGGPVTDADVAAVGACG